MLIPVATLNDLLEYHYSRRERLFDFLSQLTAEEFTRDMNVGLQSIRSTLLHSLETELFWLDHRVRGGERPDWDYRQYPDLGSVRAKAAEVQAATRGWAAGLTEEDLGQLASVRYSSGTAFTYTIAKAFLHVITHDTHHGGQVVALARQLGYTPPEIDLM